MVTQSLKYKPIVQLYKNIFIALFCKLSFFLFFVYLYLLLNFLLKMEVRAHSYTHTHTHTHTHTGHGLRPTQGQALRWLSSTSTPRPTGRPLGAVTHMEQSPPVTTVLLGHPPKGLPGACPAQVVSFSEIPPWQFLFGLLPHRVACTQISTRNTPV